MLNPGGSEDQIHRYNAIETGDGGFCAAYGYYARFKTTHNYGQLTQGQLISRLSCL